MHSNINYEFRAASSWQSVIGSAKILWVSCGELVHGLWAKVGQTMAVSHMPRVVVFGSAKVPGFVHYLYSVLSQVVHIQKAPISSFNRKLSAVSTGPIITTTKYIKRNII